MRLINALDALYVHILIDNELATELFSIFLTFLIRIQQPFAYYTRFLQVSSFMKAHALLRGPSIFAMLAILDRQN